MKSTPNIISLTGIRGIAAFYVVAHHYFATDYVGYGPSDLVSRFLYRGYLSVDLFFVLSGFVMALTYQQMFAAGFSFETFTKFMGRRIARLYPIYFLATVISLFLIFLGLAENISVRDSSAAAWGLKFLLNALLIQGWGLTGSLAGTSWSLSAEWAAYILFPALVAYCLFGRPWQAWTALLASISVLAALCLIRLPYHDTPGLLDITSYHYGLTIIRCLPEFSLGILAFRASSTSLGRNLIPEDLGDDSSRRSSGIARGDGGAAARKSRLSFISSGICLAIFALLFVPKSDFFIVLLFPPLLITLASGSKHLPGRFLSSPLAELSGKLSYSVYLLHPMFYDFRNLVDEAVTHLGYPDGFVVGGAAALVPAYGVSYLSYRCIEIPGRRILRGFFERETGAEKFSGQEA